MLKTNQILQDAQQELKRKETILRTEIILLESAPQRTDSQRSNSQSRTNSSRESAPERTQNQREILKTELTLLEKVLQKLKIKRKFSKSATQRIESDRDNSSRGNNRRS
jgi:hypothetical protein